MEKEASYSMSKGIFEMAGRPLRSRREAILLLLYTIRMFDIEEWIAENKAAKVVISINKMNRIFYVLEDKIFSMQFPFSVEMENGKITRIYDTGTGLDINAVLVSMLIGIFEKINTNGFSFDGFFDEIISCADNLPDAGMERIWGIVKFISSYDLGYIRYDYDKKHKKGLLHPLNHLDICLDTAATYKIGLEKSLNYEVFKNILDTTADCFFLNV